MVRACLPGWYGTEKHLSVPLALHGGARRRRFKRRGDVKKINRRERRESRACTGSGSTSAMQRGSAARRSLPYLHAPPSRDECREHDQCHAAPGSIDPAGGLTL